MRGLGSLSVCPRKALPSRGRYSRTIDCICQMPRRDVESARFVQRWKARKVEGTINGRLHVVQWLISQLRTQTQWPISCFQAQVCRSAVTFNRCTVEVALLPTRCPVEALAISEGVSRTTGHFLHQHDCQGELNRRPHCSELRRRIGSSCLKVHSFGSGKESESRSGTAYYVRR